ncbi:haloacid dehalogenase superfamily, subfamily IA, variant 3 with third motif having DD or ED [Butyrivibrio sp. ob235]|uniref:HAD-IA family hydrolase n=1 Tax=Butyrivibrio sp. ob235 TaxID=1761780 RepID=UPI0008D0E68A|nr:HAD-IA family hydrolase [Butyrivibrio sp. ob235]SEL92572.1 haloacid dehalogenase superfamily, subfamily IA, variant 3 with third motif having DD or ED [Butyrivibrio sp. ob235]
MLNTLEEETFEDMSLEEKCGQVFCPMGFSSEDEVLRGIVSGIGVGGMMYRSGRAKEIQDTHRKIQSMAKIPLLLAANTESGGDGLAVEGTSFGKPMAVAATADPENGYRMGYVACREGAALGLNWSFAPILDIKPDPEVFLKAAQFLAEEPKDCLVIEDAEAGIDAAVSGGFYSAGIGSAESYGKATYHLESFKDILKLSGPIMITDDMQENGLNMHINKIFL